MGYRLRCIAPPGFQGDPALDNQPRLREVEWDIKQARTPNFPFIQESTWGRYTRRLVMEWKDKSGNTHPDEVSCTALCQNSTAEEITTTRNDEPFTARQYNELPGCPTECFRYGFPAYHNPSFAYARPESAGLSEAFKVRVGDVKNLLITSPLSAHSVRAFDLSRQTDESSFVTSFPSFQMSDEFKNPNRTSVGKGIVTLVTAGLSVGAEITGVLDSPLKVGIATFPILRISCPGIGYKLRFYYRRWLYGPLSQVEGPMSIGIHDVMTESLPFNVDPVPPRLEAIKLDNTWTRLIFVFDSPTNKGEMPVQGDCENFLDGVATLTENRARWHFTRFCTRNISNACTYKPFGVLPPLCSWSDSQTLELAFGANATVGPNDLIFLKDVNMGGVPIRTEMTLEQIPLKSPPMQIPNRSCVGSRCGGHPVTSNEKLEDVSWACVEHPGTKVCREAILGQNVQDVVYVKGEQQEPQFMVVASKCLGEIECTDYRVPRGVVIYEMKVHSPKMAPGETPPYLYKLVEKQVIPASGASDIEYFELRFDETSPQRFIAVAQFFDGTSYDLSVNIYGQLEGDFAIDNYVLIQRIPTVQAVAVNFAEYGQSAILLIAQKSSASLLWLWAPGYFAGDARGNYVWNPGVFEALLQFPVPGMTSNMRVFWTGNDLMLGMSNEQGAERCSALNCVGNELTSQSTIDLFKVGARLDVDKMIPYPCDRSAEACMSIPFCLAGRYANITLKDIHADAVKYLKIGSFVEMNGEMMEIVDSTAPDSADSQLRTFEAMVDPISKVFKSMLTLQEKASGVLSMAHSSRSNLVNWFVPPMSYLHAWAAVENNALRVKKFLEYLEDITGVHKLLPTSPALIDADGDGTVDIVMGTRAGGLRVLYNTGSGFVEKNASRENVDFGNIILDAGYSAPTFVDLVGTDGLLDLILGGADGRLKVFQASRSNVSNVLNRSSVSYMELDDKLNPLAGIKVPAYSKPAFSDLDGDGALDLMVGASDGLIRTFMNISSTLNQNDTNASHWGSENVLELNVSNFSAPTFFDLDDDGTEDLVMGDITGQLHLFKMDPLSRLFFPFPIPANGSVPLADTIFGLKSSGIGCSPVFHDLDGDGHFEIVLGHSFGNVEIHHFESSTGVGCSLLANGCVVASLEEFPPRSTEEESPSTISLFEYETVFTGFRCMKPRCENCTKSAPECAQKACFGIDSDYIDTGRTTSDCEDWVPLEPADGDSCCDYSVDGYFKPCRQPGYITVQRAMRGTPALLDGLCVGSTLDETACNGRDGCICTDGMNKESSCKDDSGCMGHMPGSQLYIMLEDVKEQNLLPVFQLPGTGSKDFVFIQVHGENFIAVSNYDSGCGHLSYEQDSVIYRIDFDTNTYERHQNFLTKGVIGLQPFFRDVVVSPVLTVRRLYMLAANYRSRYGLTTKSTLYQWTKETVVSPFCDASPSHSLCKLPYGDGEQKGYFVQKYQFDSVGAIGWIQIPQQNQEPIFVQISSRSDIESSTASKAYRFIDHRPRPRPIIQGKQVVSMCSPLKLSAEESKGKSARPFKSVKWQLISGASSEWWNGKQLSSVIDSFDSSLYQTIEKSENYTTELWSHFFPPGEYTIRLTLTNWATRTASSDFVFVRLNETSPSVDITIENEIFNTDDAVSLYGFATSGDFCNSSDLGTSEQEFWSLTYKWSISSVGDPLLDIENLGLSTKINTIRIPAYTLTPGVAYTVNLEVSQGGLSSVASKEITVRAALADARIAGGEQTVFVNGEAGTSNGGGCTPINDLQLDAGTSRNLAFPQGSALASAGLEFLWTCKYRRTENSIGLNPCETHFYTCSGAICTLHLSKLPVVVSDYYFEVAVKPRARLCVLQYADNPAGASVCPVDLLALSDHAATAVSTEPSAEPAPVIRLEMKSAHTLGILDLDGGKKVSVYQLGSSTPLIIEASVELQGILELESFEWKLESGESASCKQEDDWCHSNNLRNAKNLIADNTLADPILSCPEACKCTSTLSVAPCVFKGFGALEFSLSANSKAGQQNKTGTSSIRVRFSQPPDGGSFTVSPSSGYSVVDSFELAASNWFDQVDALSSLMYSFSYKKQNCQGDTCEEKILSQFSPRPQISIRLPPGNLTLLLDVKDATGFSCPKNATVSVNVLPFSAYTPPATGGAGGVNSTTENCSSIVAGCSNTGGSDSGSGVDLGSMTISDYIEAKVALLMQSSDPAATVQEIGTLTANLNLPSEGASQSDRSKLITVLMDAWERVGVNPEPYMALQTAEVALDVAGTDLQLDGPSTKSFQNLLSKIGTSVLNKFRGRQSNEQTLIIAEADAIATLMSTGFGKLIKNSPWSTRRHSHLVPLTESSLLRSEGSVFEDSWDAIEHRMRFNTRALADSSDPYLSMLSIVDSLDDISALSVANAVPGDLSAEQTSSTFRLVTSMQATASVEGYTASLDMTRLASEPCLATDDMTECCRQSGSCCVSYQCSSWQGSFVDFAFTALLPSGLRNLHPGAYEIEIGTLLTNPFTQFDPSVNILGVSRLNMREAHSDLEYHDFTEGYTLFDKKPQAILRLPISEQSALELTEFGVTTPTQQGRVAACLNWNEVTRRWDNEGLTQAPGADATQKLCLKRAGTPPVIECSYFVECATTHLSYFAVAESPLDCEGVVLGGTAFDHCDVCGGDNSTCSGCDMIPNAIEDGVRLDRDCSGHGACNGGYRCSCCADNLHTVTMGGEIAGTSSKLTICPWFGVMCHRFCTRSLYEGIDAGSAAQKIHCSGHGSCMEPLQGGAIGCECDPGSADGNGTLCGYFIPKTFVVKLGVEFPMSVADFDELNQKRFKRSFAAAAGAVLEGSVAIHKISAIKADSRRQSAESMNLDIFVYAVDKEAAIAIAENLSEERINSELTKQQLPSIKILWGPDVELSEPMDPVLRSFIDIGVPIIAVFMAICFYIWARAWLKSRQMKIGQELVEDVVLKRLPMPTLEELGPDVIAEREILKDLDVHATIADQVDRQYKEEAVAKIQKDRATADGDKINWDLDEFRYRDAGKDIPDALVTAFITTGKFEATSDTADVGILQTYQRLEKFKAGAGKDTEGMEALWDDKDRVKDLIKAGTRVNKSKSNPFGAAGVMPSVQGSKALKQQVAAQHKQVSAYGGRTMPEFLQDYQMEQIQKHPEPVKLGKRIETAASRGPRDNALLLENGKSEAKSSNRLIGILNSITGKNKNTDDEGDGLEVMV